MPGRAGSPFGANRGPSGVAYAGDGHDLVISGSVVRRGAGSGGRSGRRGAKRVELTALSDTAATGLILGGGALGCGLLVLGLTVLALRRGAREGRRAPSARAVDVRRAGRAADARDAPGAAGGPGRDRSSGTIPTRSSLIRRR